MLRLRKLRPWTVLRLKNLFLHHYIFGLLLNEGIVLRLKVQWNGRILLCYIMNIIRKTWSLTSLFSGWMTQHCLCSIPYLEFIANNYLFVWIDSGHRTTVWIPGLIWHKTIWYLSLWSLSVALLSAPVTPKPWGLWVELGFESIICSHSLTLILDYIICYVF